MTRELDNLTFSLNTGEKGRASSYVTAEWPRSNKRVQSYVIDCKTLCISHNTKDTRVRRDGFLQLSQSSWSMCLILEREPKMGG